MVPSRGFAFTTILYGVDGALATYLLVGVPGLGTWYSTAARNSLRIIDVCTHFLCSLARAQPEYALRSS